MIWEDIVIGIANLIFMYSLIHQVVHGFRKKKGFLTLTTSLMTSIGLYAIAIAFFSLGLFASTVISVINASLWLTLFIQRIVYKTA